MPRGNKFRFTVTIQDMDKVYRNSYFNNVLTYVYSIMFLYPDKKIWVFDGKKSVFYKITQRSYSEKGFPEFTIQIIK